MQRVMSGVVRHHQRATNVVALPQWRDVRNIQRGPSAPSLHHAYPILRRLVA